MENKLNIINMADIKAQAVSWLWYPYIPFGKISIMHGDPGEGKTFLVLAITSALTKGEKILNSEQHQPMNIIYQTAEDGLADTIKPRLDAIGADCSRVLVIDESETTLSMCDIRLEQAIKDTGAKLVILDPLQAYLGSNVDMHRANEIRPIFHKLSLVAERTGCAMLLIGHLNKGMGKSSYRGLGSIDITAAARSVVIVGKSPNDPNIRIMAHSKSNLAPMGKSVAFQIKDGVQFIGECDMSVEDLLMGAPARKDVLGSAKELLLSLLSEGEQASEFILQMAKAQNISERTLKTAKKELGVVAKKRGGKWYNSLP